MSLILTIRKGEGFQIGDIAIVQVSDFMAGQATVLIDAPPEVKVTRLTNRGNCEPGTHESMRKRECEKD